MKLRTKLLLGIGFLLLAMVIVMFSLPAYFVRKDVYSAADQIHELLIEDRNELINSQKLWLNDELNRNAHNVDSILFVLHENASVASKLAFDATDDSLDVWESITKFLDYDPEIGFIQAHSSKQNQTAVVKPYLGTFYPVSQLGSHDGVEIIALLSTKDDKEMIYVGVPLPKKFQSEAGYTLYALLDSELVKEEKSQLQKGLEKLDQKHISTHLDRAEQLMFGRSEGEKSAFYWALKMDLIQLLAPMVVEGFVLEQPDKKFIPEGIARFDTSGNGVAILSDDVFQTTPLFDDILYYETHPPRPDAPLIAEGSILVTDKTGDHAFIGNTLLINETFLTVAMPLNQTIRKLALSSNKTILLRVNKTFWLGFSGEGTLLQLDQINSIVNGSGLNQKQGIVTINKEPFFFDRLISLENGDLVFFELYPFGGEHSIVNTLIELEDQLTSKISLQLSLISLGTMILVLLFVARMGLSVIYPVTKLAQATEHVVAGRYEDVVLPEVGKRKDEIAILTRSFGNMVEGLKEREHIRGVLDKVVSKEVADEILRNHIHLGGEDRIVSMLFGDIRGFSAISQHAAPQKTIQMLNSCMTKISRVIEGEGGVIDKYVGDEVMAIYGAPIIHSDHALRAVSSAMLIIEILRRWNEQRAQDEEPLIQMGIGVHTGLVVAGNMGAEDRLNYTVLGSNVNLASRLCQIAKRDQLIISEATLHEPQIAESFHVKPLDPIDLKGFKQPVPIYEVTAFKWEQT